MSSKTIIFSVLLFFVVFLTVEGADFKTTISAVFTKAQPADPNIPYYDYCGWNCAGQGIVTRNSYCDLNCRQQYNCRGFVCSAQDAYYGPFCYGTNCPGQFNAAVPSKIHLRWGAPGYNQQGQSGMGFSPLTGNEINVQEEFPIGDLTHYNFPIYSGTQVSNFAFIFTLSLNAVNGGALVVKPTQFTFPMNADETPNDWTPSNCPGPIPVAKCPYPTRFPCNQTPKCADKISFTSQTDSPTFTINNVVYTLAITGMRLAGQTVSTSNFISDEGISTTARIFGVVTRQCPTCPPGQKAYWDQKTFTCRCNCTNTCTIPGQVLQADCSCPCQPDCGLKANAKLDGNTCKCECSTGDQSQCLAPRISGDCADGSGKCCCNCPPKKCGSGKPNLNTATCDCTCPPDECKSKGPNWVASKADCSCQCPLSAKSCNSDVQVFNSTSCNCDCKPVCPSDPGQMFTRNDNCFCACDQDKLTATCKAQNKQTLFTPFDPKNPSAAQCKCGPCLTNFKPDENGVCQCSLTECTNQFVLDKIKCQCTCPPAGPTCVPPTIPDTTTCSCLPCPTGKCECAASIKEGCDKQHRTYIFNSTFCGCGPCENNFTSNSPAPDTPCDVCPLTDDSCKTTTPADKDLHFLNKTICKCQCPSNTTCPVVGDIYMPDKCACRSCLPGECVCGNGIVEAGEECDNNTDPCCDKCKLQIGQPCKGNKCGICTKNPDNTVTCANNSEKICPQDECFTSVCIPSDGTCNVTNLDGNACGDKDLCLRKCMNGKCLNYTDEEISGRCDKQNSTDCTSQCCSYKCRPADGKCYADWTTTLNQTCNDGLTCTDNDVCVNNTGNTTEPLKCAGTPKCTNLGNPPACMQWECAEYLFGKCITTPINSTNATCPADGYCTLPGACAPTGECIRPLRPCDSTDPCKVGRCNEELKSCEFVTDLANGLPCDDNSNCTENDVCVDGDCQGKQACNSTPPATSIVVPLAVTAAVVAAAALVAGFFIFQAVSSANIMDPVSWGEVGASQFDANPLYQEATKFGDNPLYQS